MDPQAQFAYLVHAKLSIDNLSAQNTKMEFLVKEVNEEKQKLSAQVQGSS